LRATDGLAALGMFQASCGDPVKLAALKSLARSDKYGNQPFKYLLHFFSDMRGESLNLFGIRCIFWRDRRQRTFLVERQDGGFVIRAHHDP
jgi:hypothetical protein